MKYKRGVIVFACTVVVEKNIMQYIMGHADISVTLNTYTHVKFEDAEAEMKRVAAI